MPITGEKGKIYDIDWRRAEDLITQAKENLGIEVQKAENIEELCACDILCTATPSSTPLIFGASVRQGTHINAIGSNAPNRQEIDSSVLIKSKVYVDRLEQALEEAGDLIIPIKQGLYKAESIAGNLCDVLSGRIAGRDDESQITLFKSVGIALEDIAVARKAYELALKKGIGQELTL